MKYLHLASVCMKYHEVRFRSQVKGPAAVDGQWKCTRGLQMIQWLLDMCTAGSAQLANAGSENTILCVSTSDVNMDSGFSNGMQLKVHSVV